VKALIDEGVRIVTAAHGAGAALGLLGGAAIHLHCPLATARGPYRAIADLDAITTKADAARVRMLLPELGYAPDQRFNAMHGDRRLIFEGPAGKLDVFVGAFEMCHRIDLEDRVGMEDLTLPVTDLLLTKLQIVELNAKDAKDIAAILGEHALGDGPGDHLDRRRLGAVVAGDWGLWRTMTGTLAKVAELAPAVAPQAREVRGVLDDAPKTRGFRLRAMVGEKVRWYELPDEVE